MTNATYALGIDVGGTNTDLQLIRLEDGWSCTHKLPSTPHDQAQAVANGMREMLEQVGVQPAQVVYFGHGTTVGTNAVLTGRLAKAGLVTTRGFRDVLEIARQRQPHPYNFAIPKPAVPVPRRRRYEVNERTYLFGRQSHAPSDDEIRELATVLRKEGVEAVAVCFLHSYHDSGHEALVAATLRRELPEVFVCASYEVLNEYREYERVNTTVLNAGLGPILSRYLRRLHKDARKCGVVATPHVFQSNGGVASPDEASRLPVRTLASGPAAGVTGAVYVGRAAGHNNLITFDVGGTSTDVCLVQDGEPASTKERMFAGHPVKFPMVDVHSVGAGGGSIAWIDSGDHLRIGPQSAGAVPGPAGYGLGGNEPTVTDAALVLGWLNPKGLLDGRLSVYANLARQAITECIADPLGLDLERAAQAILTILNENMIRAIRLISVERGHDPRDFALLAFGGAGPLLASPLARELGIDTIVVPPNPGILCAEGLLLADARTDFGMTRFIGPADQTAAEVGTAFTDVESLAEEWFRQEGVAVDRRRIERAVDMRYVGQSHELTIGFGQRPGCSADIAALRRAFFAEHKRLYGYAQETDIEFVTFRVAAIAARPRDVRRPEFEVAEGPSRISSRPVYFEQLGDYFDCPVFSRSRIRPDSPIEGPAVIEQMDSTTVVMPGQCARHDRWGNLVLGFGSLGVDNGTPVP